MAARTDPDYRTGHFWRITGMVAGVLLILVSPLVGIIPGPGGVVVFAAGAALLLKNSMWAKRGYVRLKRRWPKAGNWTDWGMRRPSAKRRAALKGSGALT